MQCVRFSCACLCFACGDYIARRDFLFVVFLAGVNTETLSLGGKSP